MYLSVCCVFGVQAMIIIIIIMGVVWIGVKCETTARAFFPQNCAIAQVTWGMMQNAVSISAQYQFWGLAAAQKHRTSIFYFYRELYLCNICLHKSMQVCTEVPEHLFSCVITSYTCGTGIFNWTQRNYERERERERRERERERTNRRWWT